MSTHPSALVETPVLYRAEFEQQEADEEQTQAELGQVLRQIQERTFRDHGHGLRPLHAKSHGLLRGEMQVLDQLPPQLAQGLFAQPKSLAVAIRLSTAPGDLLHDAVSTPRGMAIKVFGVEGERIADSMDKDTQDFVLVNAPAFTEKDGKSFLGTLKLLASTTDRVAGAKKALSGVLRTAEAALESVGGHSSTLIGLGGHPLTHPLGETYYSQTPFRFGEYIAKWAAAPVSPDLLAVHGAGLNITDAPDGLRNAVRSFFEFHGAEWELRVQLCTDLEAMPIEDAQVEWPQERSAYKAVARIVVPAQPSWDPAEAPAMEDRLFFSPWNGLSAHRPLGSINRLRRRSYIAARQFRASVNPACVLDP